MDGLLPLWAELGAGRNSIITRWIGVLKHLYDKRLIVSASDDRLPAAVGRRRVAIGCVAINRGRPVGLCNDWRVSNDADVVLVAAIHDDELVVAAPDRFDSSLPCRYGLCANHAAHGAAPVVIWKVSADIGMTDERAHPATDMPITIPKTTKRMNSLPQISVHSDNSARRVWQMRAQSLESILSISTSFDRQQLFAVVAKIVRGRPWWLADTHVRNTHANRRHFSPQ